MTEEELYRRVKDFVGEDSLSLLAHVLRRHGYTGERTFKVGDCVFVEKQSKTINKHISMVGKTGVVEELKETDGGLKYANVDFPAHGKSSGAWGGVPLDCLVVGDRSIIELTPEQRELVASVWSSGGRGFSSFIQEIESRISKGIPVPENTSYLSDQGMRTLHNDFKVKAETWLRKNL